MTETTPSVRELPALSIDGVSHAFARKQAAPLQVLQNIDVTVMQGEVVALVGPSGCGKSTLFKILSGLIRPDEGGVAVGDKAVVGPNAEMGFVFQNDRLLPWKTVRENVAFGLRARGVDKRTATAKADEMINLVGLVGFGDVHPHQLSGGMRQRVNIARSLALEPKVLLMDEPFSALDAQTREVMQEELLEIWNRAGSTVLFITHQIDEAVFLADSVVVMRARPGRIATTLDIDLPKPRTLDVKRDPRFTSYVDYIWGEIESQVRESARLEA
ncbi:NitT/TauT family transport system ATP-binding protein [Arthrobacter sp. 9AX]|uniref:ABC transporter ATP-binding protein n=1 Tax=Arthrobacter sp. 9AX TaxID=2653131 RepID=UPI0012F06213|nr:ABC transporter ATP-binding protein [Arthrobacter sp. 9AX]VXB03110.1 NitT/TauT family transport system ATP-binding protein [Arthrobacter sp. 9AX]